MNELHKAYQALGLEPGTLFDAVRRRYRRLALVWHPDRMMNKDAKREAEEEIKKINNMFEKLKKHFESEHRSGPSCRCQPAAAGPPPNAPPPNSSQRSAGNQKTGPQPSSGPTEAERKRQEEEATRKRTEERQRKAAQEEAARRAAEAAQTAQKKQQAAEEAIRSEAQRNEEVLRWKCAQIIGIVFVSLIAYCWLGCLGRDITHGIGKQWEDFQSWLSPKPQEPAPSPFSQSPNHLMPPYVPPYEQLPTDNMPSWRQSQPDWPFAPPAPPPSTS